MKIIQLFQQREVSKMLGSGLKLWGQDVNKP